VTTSPLVQGRAISIHLSEPSRRRGTYRAGLLTLLAAGFSFYPLVVTAKPAAAATIGGEQALAARLASQIDAQGNRMSLLAEQYDEASIKAGQVNGQLNQAQKTLVQTQDHVNKIQTELRHQAVAAYVQDGSVSRIQALLQSNQSDLALKQHYLTTAAGDEQSTVDSLNQARQVLNTKKAALSNAKVATDKALATVSGAQRSAASEAAQEQRTLSQVKGTLTTLVQQAQAQQAAAQAQKVQSALAAQAAQATTAQATRNSATPSPSSGTKASGSNTSTAARANTAQTNTAQTNTAQTNTAQTNTAQTNTAQTNTAQTNTAQTNTAQTNTAQTNSGQTNSATTNTTNGGGGTTTTGGTSKTPGGANPVSNIVHGPSKVVTKAVPHLVGGLIGSNANTGASSAPVPSPAGGASTAIAWAQREIGKPYVWAAAGPDSFDCSGLMMFVWGKAGVSLPHSAQGQYDVTTHVSVSQLQPGDLVFYDSPVIGHVGMYVGGGQMIVADHTGTDIRYASIYRSGIIGGGRVA